MLATSWMILAGLWLGGAPIGDEILVQRVGGESLRAHKVELAEAGAADAGAIVAWGSGDDSTRIPLDSIVGLHFHSPRSTPDPQASEIELVNGDRILGEIESGSEVEVRVRTTVGSVSVEIEHIRRILFPAFRRLSGPEPDTRPNRDTDRLFRVTGKGVDIIEGTLISFDENGAVFSGPVGNFPFRYSELAALVLTEPSPAPPPAPPYMQVRGRDGSRLTGRLRALRETDLVLASDLLGEITLPIDQVTSLTHRSPRFEFLSDLDPAEVEELPYFGFAKEFLFHYRRDRTVSGGPLILDGMRYEKGLGLHSRCTLTYALGGKYETFHAIIGIDDEVGHIPATGRLVFRVIVDGETRYDSGIVRHGDASRPLPPVSLRDAKRLAIQVDFGDDSDAGDRAVWANAVLRIP